MAHVAKVVDIKLFFTAVGSNLSGGVELLHVKEDVQLVCGSTRAPSLTEILLEAVARTSGDNSGISYKICAWHCQQFGKSHQLSIFVLHAGTQHEFAGLILPLVFDD